ncbi:MAG: tRNA uridine(34) 5-carboxymethylaminomethyl modification radical SAM/GNAT enzyme Elp3 [Dehalococcoidales bacterium]|nr:tRNA uridine(34) 5-carboxymethylaminomethyl modification radical SAM/GNAT enzyme Elp3 [Dehalococcoidales bacterium]
MRKISRTISGVTPVAVMTSPQGCPGKCIYCPTYVDTPQSYTPESPAVLRAKHCDYDPVKQVELRLNILSDMGHPIDKIEMIIMGGTFLSYPLDYQYQFIKGCYDALNGVESESLIEAQKINETGRHRCVGLCIETRPDWCREEDINRMISFGATRVELGVQMLDDEIYKLVKREHLVEDVIRTTRSLKERGFKVHYHWMPGLPGSTPERDLEMSKLMFEDENFKPDGLKLYPTMVVEGTKLHEWYKEGIYQPYDKGTMINLMAEIKAVVPKYVRISRVLRDIPAKFIVAGLRDSLRELLKQKMGHKGINCKCIRCREYGHRLKENLPIGEPHLNRMDYRASGGQEIFLSFEDEFNTLFGLLRLRIQRSNISGLILNSDNNIALIRELHIYGPEVLLGEKDIEAVQHKGLGKSLLAEAEKIAKEEFEVKQIAILSGVGAREYYRMEGYGFESGYMVKKEEEK